MPLSWNEIRTRAVAFSKEFEHDSAEDAEAKSFWDAFFNVFGISRRRIASFERPVKKSDGKGGFIDLLWKGVLLVEHKSRGKDLDHAFHQATDYFYGLKDRDLPQYILVSDFARIRLYDLESDLRHEFALKDLHKNIKQFGFVAGYRAHRFEEHEEQANIKAAEQLGKLHDQLKEAGYEGHKLEVLLVRLLFCLFADDTGIFEKNQFKEYLDQRTGVDGTDLGMHLAQIFQILNTQNADRPTTLDEQLYGLTYVNGRLFAETIPIPAFNSEMRETLLDACSLDWSRISPAIFGSLFQSIMNKEARRNLGAHYTREANILKALRPLFLDELDAELASIGTNQKKLSDFQRKLAGIRILDPACGCGNFLVIAYREMRRIELEVLRRLYKRGLSSRALDIGSLVYVDVDQFYGIEIEEFPAQIAQVALWLTDHQMNQLVSDEFGHYFVRLPLRKSPNIVHNNALRLDWEEVVPASQVSYVVGNPPFVGAKYQDAEQKADVVRTFIGTKNYGLLDYVCCWYRKAADYIHGTRVAVAFVSTNSITQGEQVGVLWPDILARGVKIRFAHRTFQWSSEARGKAAVHCVIIGFGAQEPTLRMIYDYEDVRGEPLAIRVANINPYLVDAPDVVLTNRSAPICDVPEIAIGNKPIDDGNYLFTDEQKSEFLSKEPIAADYFRKWLGADEFLNGYHRWCLWLGDCAPGVLRGMPLSLERVERVRKFRSASKSAPTKKLASTPTRFHVENMPSKEFVLVPKVSSERRVYIPMGLMDHATFVSDLVFILADGSRYHLGVLSSVMHMSWVRAVAGRLESRYRYSAGIVYNNFPWPEATEAQRTAIVEAAQSVLDARDVHPGSTLADLYDPLAMPANLLKAHQKLDRAVDAAYGKRDFNTEAERVAFLFDRFKAITAPLDISTPSASKRARLPK